jgi:hypothetical protein
VLACSMVDWSLSNRNYFAYVSSLLVVNANKVSMVDLHATSGNDSGRLKTFVVLLALLVGITARVL